MKKPAALTLKDLRHLIHEGAESGPGNPASAVLNRLENKYRVMTAVSPLSERDLEEIGDFIAADNPHRTVSYIREMRDRC